LNRGEKISISLEDADSARVQLNHGAGRLSVGDGTDPGVLASGGFGGGLDYRTRRNGHRLDLKMSVPEASFPFFGWPGSTLDWDVAFNRDVTISMDIKTGANESKLNLENLKVVDLKLQTGASSTEITLPARAGFTRGQVEAGAASVDIRIPEWVGARIQVRGGLIGVTVDRHRFPRQGDVYYSPDYELSQNKLDLEIQAGVGSIKVY
jgi:hypothetical protein